MAGAGYKNFAPGEVLTSSDVDNYLMEQSVMVFAGTAARGTTLTSPAEGMFSYRTDADVLEVYNGTAWVPAAQAAGAATVTNRNLLYNGAMAISQRGTSTTSITGGGYYTADRWVADVVNGGTWTQSVETDAPTGSGFRRSLRMLCTTADSSLATTDRIIIQQNLEGQDLQRIAKGTSAAQQVTLSFWVKGSTTGTYIAELEDADNSRQVSVAYSIVQAGTWERKVLTFPADTTGVLDNDNAKSLGVYFWLGAGPSFSSGGSLQTSWGNTTANRCVGQTNLAAATNNYYQVTGVQLETGPVATSFEFKSYGQELRECQRYYCIVESTGDITTGAAVSTSTIRGAVIPFPQTMRAVPTVTLATAGSSAGQIAFLTSAAQYPATIGSHAASYIAKDRVGMTASGYTSAFTAGNASVFWMNTSGTVLSASAEL